MKESNVQLDVITKKIQDNKDLSIDEVIKMEKDRRELQEHVAALSVQLKKLKDRYELLYVKSTVDGKVITKNVEQLLKNRSVVAGQVLLEIAIEPSRNITEKTANHAGEDGGVVSIPLKAEWVPEDWLKRNMGRRHLTIVADGIMQDEAKPNVVNRVQRGILHDCRLESYEKTSRDGVQYWNATFFVPRKPVYSIGALWFKDAIDTYRIGDRYTPVPSPDLTQDNPQVKLDEALAEGHSFRLDDAHEEDGAIENSSSRTNNLIGIWKPHPSTEKTWHSDDIRMAHEKLERPESNPHIDKWTLSFSADGAARFTGIEHYVGAGSESPPITLDTWLTREFDFQGNWDLRDGMLSIITDEPAVKQWKLITLTESQLVLHHETGILKVVDGKEVPETVDVVWVKQ